MPASSCNRPPRRALLGGVLGALALAAAGCSPEYEIDRPGTWQPTNINDANLRAMAADPRDFYAGQGATTARGDLGSRAVTRLLTDRRRPLLSVTTTTNLAPSGGGDTSGGGAGAGTPGQ